MNHEGAGSVTAVPEHDAPRPAGCQIFRKGWHHDGDTCRVGEGGIRMVAEDAPWHVSATFEGSSYPIDDPRRWHEKTIEAYDEDGRIVANWNGSRDYHEGHMRAIE